MNATLQKTLEIINKEPDGITTIDIMRKYGFMPTYINVLVGQEKICYKNMNGEKVFNCVYEQVQSKVEDLYTVDGIKLFSKLFVIYFPVDGNK